MVRVKREAIHLTLDAALLGRAGELAEVAGQSRSVFVERALRAYVTALERDSRPLVAGGVPVDRPRAVSPRFK